MKKTPKKKPLHGKAKQRVRGREKPISTDVTNLVLLIREAQEEERRHDLLNRYGWNRNRQPYHVFLSMWPEVVKNTIGPELARHAIAGTLHEVCRALKKNRGASRKSNIRRLVIDIIRKLRDGGGGKPPSYKDVCLEVDKDPGVLKRFTRRKRGEEWPDSLERYVRKVAKEERLLLAELK